MRKPDTLVLTATLAIRFRQRFFQLSQVIAGNILSAVGSRLRAESPRGLIGALGTVYAVTKGPYTVKIFAFHRNCLHSQSPSTTT
jgi:hypothetical protein